MPASTREHSGLRVSDFRGSHAFFWPAESKWIERATNSHTTLRHAVLRGEVPHALAASPFKWAVQNS